MATNRDKYFAAYGRALDDLDERNAHPVILIGLTRDSEQRSIIRAVLPGMTEDQVLQFVRRIYPEITATVMYGGATE